ncbi:MAG: MBL fold metallo-hydrolase [Candidatus Altiarchaeota archaeon]|nr:MBL fold metallo-hydrolase [Candidatus Altiarchaeota archaeon]
MKLTILYDNEVCRKGLKPGFGFSCLIEAAGRNILFDVGWDGGILLHNMKALDLNPPEVDVIVLSHEHWDHAGGLNQVLAEVGDVVVYVPASFSDNMKKEIKLRAGLTEVKGPQELLEGVYSTGELPGTGRYPDIREQSLAVKSREGLVVVTGCSHPGLDVILKKASGFGKLYGVVGGFHGFNRYDALKGLELIVPTHCTVHKKEIRDRYKDKVEQGGVGWSKEI